MYSTGTATNTNHSPLCCKKCIVLCWPCWRRSLELCRRASKTEQAKKRTRKWLCYWRRKRCIVTDYGIKLSSGRSRYGCLARIAWTAYITLRGRSLWLRRSRRVQLGGELELMTEERSWYINRARSKQNVFISIDHWKRFFPPFSCAKSGSFWGRAWFKWRVKHAS